MVSEHGMKPHDAEVVIAAACLFHDTGMSIHRTDHEQYSLFLAADRLPLLLEGIYEEPELTVVTSEALHAVIGHRRRGDPITVEAGIVRVADALDMASGRSRIPFETRRPNIHSISAAAIDDGHDRARRGARGADRDRDEQLGRPVPGRRAAGHQAARLRASRSTSRWWRRSMRNTRSDSCPCSASDRLRYGVI